MPQPKEEFKLTSVTYQRIFDELYVDLCRFSIKYVRIPEIAEEIVQELFIHLWEKRNEIHLTSSYKSYLLTSTKNRCLNYLKSKWARTSFTDNFLNVYDNGSIPDQQLEGMELQEILNEGIRQLPEKSYIVFSMKRFGGFTNKEVATELGISEKTVENHMTTALKKIKAFMESHYAKILVLGGILQSYTGG